MSASALLARLKEAGVTVEPEGGNLRLKGPKAALGKEVLTELRANKAELLDALKTPPAPARSQEGVIAEWRAVIGGVATDQINIGQSAGHIVCDTKPDVRENRYPTFGPQHRYGDILFIEKEGFMPLFNQVQLAERYDIAIMSTKGMSVTSSRELVDELCSRHNARLLVLHDFDKAGFSIVGTLKRATRRYDFKNEIEVLDLGIRIGDIEGLQSEAAGIDHEAWNAARKNLAENGATPQEIDFLLHERVELNAFASDALIAWIEAKLAAHGVRKVVPDEDTLTHAYERAYKLAAIQKLIDAMLASRSETAPIIVPPDLGALIEKQLEAQNSRTWDSIVFELAEKAARNSLSSGE
jgi:hypothetical protein